MISFIVDGCMYSFGMICPAIQAHFKITQEEVNLITSLYTGFMFLSGPVVAGLAKALGVRALAVGGGAVMALMLVASTYAPNISVMYICYGVVGGVATGCLYIGSLIITSQYFDKKMGMAMGICMSGSGFGSFSFPPLTNYVLEHHGWKGMLLVTAGLIALAAGLSLLFKPVPSRLVAQDPTPEVTKQELAKAGTPVAKFQSTTSIFQSRNSLTNRQPVIVTLEKPASKQKPLAAFTGSLVSLSNFNQTLNMQTLEEEFVEQPWYDRTWQIIVKIAKDIVDVKLLGQNVQFLFITLCNFFCFNALFIPYIYAQIHCDRIGLSKDESGLVYQVIGITNIPMRLFLGWFADQGILSAVIRTIYSLIGMFYG